jgi:hypothetical protein
MPAGPYLRAAKHAGKQIRDAALLLSQHGHFSVSMIRLEMLCRLLRDENVRHISPVPGVLPPITHSLFKTAASAGPCAPCAWRRAPCACCLKQCLLPTGEARAVKQLRNYNGQARSPGTAAAAPSNDTTLRAGN